MALMYERSENEHEVKIIFTQEPTFFIILGVLVVLSFFPLFGPWFVPLVIVLMVFRIATLWKPRVEIKKAMSKGNVALKGKRFSYKNPITATITK